MLVVAGRGACSCAPPGRLSPTDMLHGLRDAAHRFTRGYNPRPRRGQKPRRSSPRRRDSRRPEGTALIAPEGRRHVATGEAQRNPWKGETQPVETLAIFPSLPRRGRGLLRVDESPNERERLAPAGGMLSAPSREHAELPAKHHPSRFSWPRRSTAEAMPPAVYQLLTGDTPVAPRIAS
jgi:hypothetical protein